VLFTPSWIAGIHDRRVFLLANAIAALMWVLLIGLGAYLLGPPITERDRAGDAGLAGGLLLGALVVLAVVVVMRLRSHTSA
jgi:membrane protein DedA with SNARE-associated domain